VNSFIHHFIRKENDRIDNTTLEFAAIV